MGIMEEALLHGQHWDGRPGIHPRPTAPSSPPCSAGQGNGADRRADGLSREQLYRSFSARGNPTLKTTLAVMKALGVQLTTKVEEAA